MRTGKHSLFACGGGTTLLFLAIVCGGRGGPLGLVKAAAASSSSSSTNKDLCVSPTNIYTVKVDIFASERGYYQFEECGDVVNPVIGMEYGETYTFIQDDRTNYMHPLRFSYFPDGQHLGGDLLAPNIKGGTTALPTGTSSSSSTTTITTNDNTNPTTLANDCSNNMTCPAPMYHLNDGYLGTYSNIPEIATPTVNEPDYGWDLYLDFFEGNIPNWKQFGTFSVQLKFDDETYTQDLFYYCWAHQYMAGRIKLLKNGQPVQEKNEPAMYYAEETRSEFDQMCGTYGLEAYKLPHPLCPSEFVCDVDESMRDFSSCIEAMNCMMMVGMTNKVSSGSEIALFIHQMIPHHQNAVNMAKALLKAGFLPCDDLTDQEDPYCIMQGILYGIVASQNHEIGIMRGVLSALQLPPTDNCEVPIGDQGEEHLRRNLLFRS